MVHTSRSFFRRFWLILMLLPSVQCTNKPLKLIDGKSVAITPALQSDQEVDAMIAPYKSDLDAEMSQVINEAEMDLRAYRPESELGNVLADLVLQTAQDSMAVKTKKPVDFALLNKGGIRTNIPKGPITVGLVYEVMPFENTMVVVTLSGERTQKLFEQVSDNGGEPISGARLLVHSDGSREVWIQGEPLDPTRSYRIVTSDYLAKGGDRMTFFQDPQEIHHLDVKIRTAIIGGFRQKAENHQTISATLEGRIIYEN
jgi:2',3'-cyclic-nucleotide 2'-phosphodiesterase (5'-nucleotidase family)